MELQRRFFVSTKERVLCILAEVLDMEEDDLDGNMDLNSENDMDDLLMAKFVIACEKEFHITIQDERVCDFHTVKDVCVYVNQLLSESEGNTAESSQEERMSWYYI
jgi:acyl carrier protein